DYYIGGAYNSPSESQETGDMCIVKLDDSGVVQWFKTYGNVSTGEKIVDMLYNVGPLSDDELVVFGFIESGTSGISDRDFWLSKIVDLEETTTEDGTPGFDFGVIFLFLSFYTICSRRRRRK
ncbi:MAG: hypothetical protein ACXAAT_05130, partial [Candidatus Hodarchaeales archaeon]